MKQVLLLVAFISCMTFYSGQDFYERQWKIIKEKTQEGNAKSLLPTIINIQNQAMKDKNIVELIKSLRSEFALSYFEDDEQNNSATQFFKKLEITEKKLPSNQQLLFSVFKGKFVEQYFETNAWKIQKRTNMESSELSEIETWSKLDFKNYLSKHYTQLQSKKNALKAYNTTSYKDLYSDNEYLDYFPSIWELVTLDYIAFLKESNYFTVNEVKNNQAKVMQLYDELIAGKTGNTKLYYQTLKEEYECEKTNCKDLATRLKVLYDNAGDADYKVALAAKIGQQLINDNKSVEANKLIQSVKKAYPNSQFIGNIKNVENRLTESSLTVEMESSVQANQPTHLFARYKNMESFQVDIYTLDKDAKNFLQYLATPYNVKNPERKLYKTIQFKLKNNQDFKEHTSSLVLEGLPIGIYEISYKGARSEEMKMVVVSSETKILPRGTHPSQKERPYFMLFNKENGQLVKPAGLKVRFFANQQNKSYNIKLDANGGFTWPEDFKNNRYYGDLLIEEVGTSNLHIMNYSGDYTPRTVQIADEVSSSQIFLDRGIYRPGQIVYFKVINTALKNDKTAVISGVEQLVILKDANGNEVSSQRFITNEFGSYNGKFVLPSGLLNGLFRIDVQAVTGGGAVSRYFSVEEYKRPQFEVVFEPVKGEYKFGQKLQVKGKVSSYSGVPLGNTTVDYEIKKRDIRYWYFGKGSNSGNENPILGTTTTNEKGEFVIEVNLEKDESIEGIQVFNYEFEASVTDINGETQTAETEVRVASVSHIIEATVEEQVFAESKMQVKVQTKNYNNQELDKSYTYKLSKIEGDTRTIRPTFKNKVQDLPLVSKEEFVSKLPFDYYSKNEFLNKRPKTTVIEKNTNDKILNFENLQPGNYELELYNIEGRDTIKTTKYFRVYSKKNLVPSLKPFLQVLSSKSTYTHGEVAKFYIYSAVPNAKVTVLYQDGKGNQSLETHALKNGILVYEKTLPQEKQVESVNFQFQLLAFNAVETLTKGFSLKSQDEALGIEMLTFRDRLQPNTKEEWKVKIKGKDKEKVSAELLAAMYDKSLDVFSSNSFYWKDLGYRPVVFSTINVQPIWKSIYDFKYLRNSVEKWVNMPYFSWSDDNYVESVYVLKPQFAPASKVLSRVEYAAGNLKPDAAVMMERKKEVATDDISEEEMSPKEKVPVRENLNETAFFYPDLYTDSEGNVEFSFTSPEALTKWKLLLLAHTKDGRAATLEKEVVTQKDLSVTPNYPRFLREGDEMVLQTKIASLVGQTLNGNVTLKVLDALTNENISQKFGLTNAVQNFSLSANESTVASWRLKIPNDVKAVIFQVVAKAGQFADGEQKAIAILPNRILLTDSQPIFVKEGETKTFVLENLKNLKSKTVTNVSNSLELTTNPIWEVIFALPSLKNDVNSSADVLFNKWYADVVAMEIFKANPKLKTIFDEYQSKGLLTSNLEKNQELKQLLLEETPWILESKDEKEQMQKIARLFEVNNMRYSIESDWQKLAKLQNADGGFGWLQDAPSSYSTSLYILKQLGKLNHWLGDNQKDYLSTNYKVMVDNLINYADSKFASLWKPENKFFWANFVADYLETRHYWEAQYPLKDKGKKAKTAAIEYAKKANFKDFTFYGLHRTALLFNHYGLKDASKKLLHYLKETSTHSQTQGVYWKTNLDEWGWYGSKILNHTGALEAFNKVTPEDISYIEELKIWLVTQKEVGSWGSSRATADVIYLFLNSGKSWTTTESEKVNITWGGEAVQTQTHATGYLKETKSSQEVKPSLAEVTVHKKGPGVVQGGVFWQYYEDLDKVKSSETYLAVTKELYKKVKTENGDELRKITSQSPLKIGDKVTVRMILNTDRNMEYVHIKDMRAAGFEPLSTISGYQWKNSLGYYQTTKDASTNFYIEYMPKGKYVFEYDVICNAAGTFSNGITTLQNYYAPQMNARTQGQSVVIQP